MRSQLKEGAERNDRCYIRVWSEGRWKLKQRYVWEKHHGPIPPGHRICFLDGNQKNLDLDNLILVPTATSMSVCKTLGSVRIPELTRAQIALFELQQAVRGRRYEGEFVSELWA